MTTFTINELAIPASTADASFSDFAAMVAVRNAVVEHTIGGNVLATTPEEVLPSYQDQQYHPRRPLVVRSDGRIIGRGTLAWYAEEGAIAATITAEVLPSYQNRGIGTALFDRLEALAREAGWSTLQSWAVHSTLADGERLPSPSGFGELPMADPGVRFLAARGYQLEQVSRLSTLALPVDPERLATSRRNAEARAGADYRLVFWQGATPDRWLDDLAYLRNRMSVDMPRGGMDVTEETWDTDRVRDLDAREEAAGGRLLTVAAVHVPSSRMVGFSVLIVRADLARPVSQEDTLVLSEHRGHRLGILMKAANLQELALASPSARLVITGNAEENRYMLSVNEAIGFRPLAYQGSWQRALAGA